MTVRRGDAAAFASSARRLSGLTARLLGWRPNEFWSATPDELEAALGGGDAGAGDGPSPSEVAMLMALHPDEKDRCDGGRD